MGVAAGAVGAGDPVTGTACADWVVGRRAGPPTPGSPGSEGSPPPEPGLLFVPNSTVHVVLPGASEIVCPIAVLLGVVIFTVALPPGGREPADGETVTVPLLPLEAVILQWAWVEPLLVSVIVVPPGGIVRKPPLGFAVSVPLGAGGELEGGNGEPGVGPGPDGDELPGLDGKIPAGPDPGPPPA